MAKKFKLRSPIDYRYILNRRICIITQGFYESLIYKFYKGKPHSALDIQTQGSYKWMSGEPKNLRLKRTKAEKNGEIPIAAAHDGYLTVEHNDDQTEGVYMKVKDGDWETLYFHLSSVRLWKDDDKTTAYEQKNGQNFVKAGTVIGTGGNSGRFTTGAHLHFELRHKGVKVDPIPYLQDNVIYQRYRGIGKSTFWYNGKEITNKEAQQI